MASLCPGDGRVDLVLHPLYQEEGEQVGKKEDEGGETGDMTATNLVSVPCRAGMLYL